ncbi:general stress protein [Methylotenera sp.]|uniref:general stress protein n=1 Tax=Methylotenera sp. TaxID=2051956 RepID=UPI002734803F|nr:general stress protein [Methylotenera sp.]MDP3776302.1 general stress protein [Methylotenera sp.]
MSLVTGLFKDQNSAENAYKSLSASGYKTNEIDVVMSEETRKKYYGKDATLETEVGNKAAEGAAIGGVVGSTAGAIAAAFAAVGTSLAVPGLGLVIAGPIAAAIAGAGAGGVTAGIVGALIGWGIPEDRLKEYEQGINDGGILIGVKAKSDEDSHRFENDWKNQNGNQVVV